MGSLGFTKTVSESSLTSILPFPEYQGGVESIVGRLKETELSADYNRDEQREDATNRRRCGNEGGLAAGRR